MLRRRAPRRGDGAPTALRSYLRTDATLQMMLAQQREDSQRRRDEAAKMTEILSQVLDRLTISSRARGGSQQSSRISIAG